MSESAAPSGSSRCVSEVDLFSDKPRVEQQDYTFAAQQKPGMLTLRLNCIGWVMIYGIRAAPRILLSNGRVNLSEDPKFSLSSERLTLLNTKLVRSFYLNFTAETITRRLKLYRADEIGQEITNLGNTALHVAAQANCIDFVKELLKMMSTEDLAKKNKIGCTAFFYAAGSGMVEIVEEAMKGNKDIAMVPGGDGTLPIVRAAALGQRQTVVLLYEKTKGSLTDDECIELLVKLIETDLYAVALRLLKDRPQLATKRDRNEETALHVLARKNLTSSNQNPCGGYIMTDKNYYLLEIILLITNLTKFFSLFSEKHKELKRKGETWMKDTASSCMIVATLIATIVFAAAITVPGGNKEDTGLPFFRQKASFKIFAVSNVISLVASSVSIVNFLSIVAPRYAEEDFLHLLPRKLLVGFATLFVAIAAMMVVFSATSYIVFKDGSLWIAILAIVISSIPVILFVKQHFLFFYDVLRSTYASHYLIRKGKISLFYKAGETTTTKHQWKTKLFNGSNLTIPCTSSCSTNV
ncbi:hypothetical protein KPL70_025390 [Citrus sinensis]|nr:hypothetical protein KPL70_025390 [Citrus sinensis]